ncbi:DUF3995 domain-containing protein [Nocardia jiangsuensis]|uniref:DUF3995 domain-containing protein n=1 Tax=Nocardia jiangsuensis TaxID=1691563 RepID=A0ABV8DSP4_9NOCA
MRTDVASAAFGVAAAAGLVHAAASLFWALGGRWQLESVGQWAVQLAHDHPIRVGLLLGLVTLVKVAAAVVPLVNERREGRFHRSLRWGGWAGGAVLVVWGGLSSLSACAVLAGVVTPGDGYNRSTMIGHAFVWDPLFVLWGAALLTGLWLTRARRPQHP